jgi:rhodanese-related sulfurtransferase
MSQVRTVTPEEAQALLQDGYAYVDVRNELEFEQGHPAGAFNVPITLQTDFGPEPNEQFVEVISKHFALDAKLIVGCASGVRSGKAVRLLTEAGFTNLVDQKAGFGGSRDPFGRKSPGWRDSGLPIEIGQPEGKSYKALHELTQQ